MDSTRQTRSTLIAVLICIVAAVLIFGRRPAPTRPTTTHDDADKLVMLRGNASLSLPGQSLPSHNPIPDTGEPIDWSTIDSEQRDIERTGSVRSLPVARSTRVEPAITDSPMATTSHAFGSDFEAGTTALVETERPVKYHRIVEGDTLRDLAGRYLGSSDRYLELFYANRAVLPHPDVLPLHARIVIPEATDPLAASLPAADTAESPAASPWSSRPAPPEGIRLPEITGP